LNHSPDRPKVKSVEKMCFTALYDTGATKSVMSTKPFKTIEPSFQTLSPNVTRDLNDAHNRKLKTLGTSSLEINYEDVLQQQFKKPMDPLGPFGETTISTKCVPSAPTSSNIFFIGQFDSSNGNEENIEDLKKKETNIRPLIRSETGLNRLETVNTNKKIMKRKQAKKIKNNSVTRLIADDLKKEKASEPAVVPKKEIVLEKMIDQKVETVPLSSISKTDTAHAEKEFQSSPSICSQRESINKIEAKRRENQIRTIYQINHTNNVDPKMKIIPFKWIVNNRENMFGQILNTLHVTTLKRKENSATISSFQIWDPGKRLLNSIIAVNRLISNPLL
jgi:hypothetical protein